MEINLAQLEGTPKQIAWAEKIRARKLELIAARKLPIIGWYYHKGRMLKSVSNEIAAAAVRACPSAYCFILTRDKPLCYIIQHALAYYTGATE